jgi:hypothetical protein
MVDVGAIFARALRPTEGNLPPELARHWMDFKLTPEELSRYAALSDKAQLNTLNEDEATELDQLLMLNDLLSLLKVKARLSTSASSAA